jgi:molecular chaperone GrpE
MPIQRLEPEWFQDEPDGVAAQAVRTPQSPAPEEPPPPDVGATPAETDLEHRWRRAATELDNLRKRYAGQVAYEQAAERARVTMVWLPVLDNLDLALAHADGEAPVVQEVRMVRDQAVAALAALGYARHDDTGVPFDPMRHEALVVRPTADVPPGTVVEVVRPGYGEGDRQLRPAAVVVSGDVEDQLGARSNDPRRAVGRE